jgi:outer membrane protein OmpA-like peptidoglycan-associated protein
MRTFRQHLRTSDGAGRRGLRQASRRVVLALAVATFVAALCTATDARAEVDSRLGLSFRNVVSGKKRPAILLQPTASLQRLTVKLKRADGATKTLRSGPVAAGQRKEIPVDQPMGRYAYRGEFEAKWAGGDKSSFAMTFELTRVGKLQIEIDPKDVDLDARKMTFRISNPAKRARLTFVGTGGKVILSIKKEFHGAAPGTPLKLRWKKLGRDVSYIDLKVTDITGFWTAKRLTPFFTSVPHDDVVFDTDKWVIKRKEEPKLVNTLAKIREMLDKHGKALQVRLFVAGYTDTMSSRAHNQRLSENRARSIATWFRRKGLRIPIFYQGFGEDVLAVDTPDQTPEQRNRRALYLLATQKPAKSRQVPRDHWKKL